MKNMSKEDEISNKSEVPKQKPRKERKVSNVFQMTFDELRDLIGDFETARICAVQGKDGFYYVTIGDLPSNATISRDMDSITAKNLGVLNNQSYGLNEPVTIQAATQVFNNQDRLALSAGILPETSGMQGHGVDGNKYYLNDVLVLNTRKRGGTTDGNNLLVIYGGPPPGALDDFFAMQDKWRLEQEAMKSLIHGKKK